MRRQVGDRPIQMFGSIICDSEDEFRRSKRTFRTIPAWLNQRWWNLKGE
jgi:hypothetical protein